MDLVGPHPPSFDKLVNYFWKTKPIIQVHNCDFTFHYSETVDVVKDNEVLTTVMIELTCKKIKNLPILSVAQTCFNALKDQAHETNLAENSECSNPRRLEENRQRAEQYYLQQQSQEGSGMLAIPTASSSVSGLEINSENRDKEHILTQTHVTKKVKSPKKLEQDRGRAEKNQLKKPATTKERICQMWAVPAEARSVISNLKSDSESSDKES